MKQNACASALDGLLMWGSFETIPTDCDYILDTRHNDEMPYDEVPEGSYHVESFPIRFSMEPEFNDLWEAFESDVVDVVKEGRKLYILDTDGTERAAMIAWYVFTKIRAYRKESCHPEDTLSDFQPFYLAWENRPKQWINTRVPRFARQVMWGMWKLMGCSWESFCLRYGGSMKKGKNGPMRLSGDVCCGEVIHRSISERYRVVRKPDYVPIHIRAVGGLGEIWPDLKPEFITNIKYRFQHINDSIAIQDASTLQHLWRSLFVYNDRHLDADGKPNAQFFLDQDMISRHTGDDSYTYHIWENFPDGVWWFGVVIPYETALVYIFSPLYAYFVEKTKRYVELKDLVTRGINVMLLDFDAFAFEEHGFTYHEYTESQPKKWGISHILLGMLKNDRPWHDEDVILSLVVK